MLISKLKRGLTIVFLSALVSACGGGDEEAKTDDRVDPINEAELTTLTGYAQKGPFIAESQILITPFNVDGTPSVTNLVTEVLDDTGRFEFEADLAKAQFYFIEATGYYHDETTGQKTEDWIMLRGYVFVDSADDIAPFTVNVATDLVTDSVLDTIATLGAAPAILQAEQKLRENATWAFQSATPFNERFVIRDGEPAEDSDAELLVLSATLSNYVKTINTEDYVPALRTFLTTQSEEFSLNQDIDTTLWHDQLFAHAYDTTANQLIENLSVVAVTTSIPNTDRVVDLDKDGAANFFDDDDDGDGVYDADDVFPYYLYESLDSDGDGVGNNADVDDDNDGTLDDEDAFPLLASEQTDNDSDGVGDNNDADDDNDGVADQDDLFPYDESESMDNDMDGIGNNRDEDDDNDGVKDDEDAFPFNSSEQKDYDRDGIGDNEDEDDDNDGVFDTQDAFPLDANETIDNDQDGVGDNQDQDDDNDSIIDLLDAFPFNSSESVDSDGDGIGNNSDDDDDGDQVLDINDTFPLNPNESADFDADGVGDNQDKDDDNDGMEDDKDAFPYDSSESEDTDLDGFGNNADSDDDNDGVDDEADAFPLDSTESVDTDNDGIGNNADTDDDGDGVSDDDDAFPHDAEESADTDNDGIGNNADINDDNDQIIDEFDAFPLDPTEWRDSDADGIGNNADEDDDNDGYLDEIDELPLNPNEWLDFDGDGIGNNSDPDDDNDGALDEEDLFPFDETEWADADGDTVGDNADLDDDNDGVVDTDDDFPFDPSESRDADYDGIGNNADSDDDNDGVLDADDAFPSNNLCSSELPADQTCYESVYPSAGFISAFSDNDSIVNLFVSILDKKHILQWDTENESIVSHFNTSIGSGVYPTNVVYHSRHNRIYMSYGDGSVHYIDVAEGGAIYHLITMPETPMHMAEAGHFLMLQDNQGAWESHHTISEDGDLVSSLDWNHYSRFYAWNETLDRLYFFRDTTSPNDIHYEPIDQTTGVIGQDGESPYHSQYSIQGPILIINNDTEVLLGAGDVYEAETLNYVSSIGRAFSYGVSTEEYIATLDAFSVNQNLNFFTHDKQLIISQSITGDVQGMVESHNGVAVITGEYAGINIQNYPFSADTDNDGIDNLDDAFPFDAAASLDSDGDGAPDRWNDSFDPLQSETQLIIDMFPDDSACQLTSHGVNGVCDINGQIPSFYADQMYTKDGKIYLLSAEFDRVFVWDMLSQQYENPVYLNTNSIEAIPQKILVSPAGTLLVAFQSGIIKEFSLLTPISDRIFASYGTTIDAMIATSEHIYISVYHGFETEGDIYDSNGALLTTQRTYYAQVYAASANTSGQEIALLSGNYGENVSFGNIDSSGVFNQSFSTQYSSGANQFIEFDPDFEYLISGNGDKILLQSGSQIYNVLEPMSDELAGSNHHITDIVWMDDLAYAAVSSDSSGAYVAGLSLDTEQFVFQLEHVAERIVGLASHDNNLIVVTASELDGTEIDVYEMEADQDGDQLPGWWELANGLSDTDAADAVQDPDGDLLLNHQEFVNNTNPNEIDTDQDGLDDFLEVASYLTDPNIKDSDSDGLWDGVEVNLIGSSPTDADSDDDGLTDAEEVNIYETNPLSEDTDGDTMLDPVEIANQLDPLIDDAALDEDADGLTNLEEISFGTDPYLIDTDGDQLTDFQEIMEIGSSALLVDSDEDFMHDGWEYAAGLDPIDANDATLDLDADTFTNVEEFFHNTYPNDGASFPLPISWDTHQGGPAHLGYSAQALDYSNFSLRWEFSDVSGLRPIVAADGHVFATATASYDDKVAMAINATTGELDWSAEIYAEYIDPPAYADGKMIFKTGGHDNSFLYGFDASSGSQLYATSYGNQWSQYMPSVIVNDRVFTAGGYYGGIYSFNATTGSELWYMRGPQQDRWAPAVDENYAYVVLSGQLYAYDLDSGELEFNFEISLSGYSNNQAPLLTPRGSLIDVQLGSMTNIDLNNRAEAWNLEYGFAAAAPAYDLGTIFAIRNGDLVALEESTGEQIWQWSASETLTSNVIATRNLIFVASDSVTYAIDRMTRQSVWSFQAGGKLVLSDEGALYISNSNSITAINMSGDGDADGIPGWWEDAYGMSDEIVDDANFDEDEDGLSALEEFNAGTNPLLADSDTDGLTDMEELNDYLTDPMKVDTDGDGLPDGVEVSDYGTSPIMVDTDEDLFSDYEELYYYETDPLDGNSVPDYTANFAIDFEGDLSNKIEAVDGAMNWAIASDAAYSGVQSFASGPINHDGSSAFVYTDLFANGVLSFQVRIESESCCDYLRVYVDDVNVYTLSGIHDWQNISIDLSSGEHEIKFEYSKDGSVDRDADKVWLDDLEFHSL